MLLDVWMWWWRCWRGRVRGEMWNMTQEGAAYDNATVASDVKCEAWFIFWSSRLSPPGEKKDQDPWPKSPSISQSSPLRPQHRGDKVIGNRESKEILREREREEGVLLLYIKSAQSYKWWWILLTTDNFLISLKSFTENILKIDHGWPVRTTIKFPL